MDLTKNYSLYTQAEQNVLDRHGLEVSDEYDRLSLEAKTKQVAALLVQLAPTKTFMCIKILRAAFGTGLAEAKRIVEAEQTLFNRNHTSSAIDRVGCGCGCED